MRPKTNLHSEFLSTFSKVPARVWLKGSTSSERCTEGLGHHSCRSDSPQFWERVKWPGGHAGNHLYRYYGHFFPRRGRCKKQLVSTQCDWITKPILFSLWNSDCILFACWVYWWIFLLFKSRNFILLFYHILQSNLSQKKNFTKTFLEYLMDPWKSGINQKH